MTNPKIRGVREARTRCRPFTRHSEIATRPGQELQPLGRDPDDGGADDGVVDVTDQQRVDRPVHHITERLRKERPQTPSRIVDAVEALDHLIRREPVPQLERTLDEVLAVGEVRRPMPGSAACATVAAALADMVDATPAFRRWNRRLYNPLCVTLAIPVAIASRSRS
ncbi:MAG: DUF3995 domain-containing protein [Ilumatobacteraceae bacterium]